MTIPLLILTLFASAMIEAQERDQPPLGRVETTRKTMVRSGPKYGSHLVATLAVGTQLRWVEGRRLNGFLRVLAPKGPAGWVPEEDVRVLAEPAGPGAAITAGEPCADDLDACPESGCHSPGSEIGLRNIAKRRTPSGSTPVRVTFTDMASLQDQTDALFEESQGREFSAEDRKMLQGFEVSNGTVGEGSLVRIIGWLSAGKNNPHPNSSGESVNCNLKKTGNNDFHISIASNSVKDEYDGIVIEAIPQDRNPKWTVSRMKKVKNQKRKIWIEGGLFYDNPHVVNAGEEGASNQPKRFSLWEIHPVTKFLVCAKSQGGCNNDDESQWVKLEDFQ